MLKTVSWKAEYCVVIFNIARILPIKLSRAIQNGKKTFSLKIRNYK